MVQVVQPQVSYYHGARTFQWLSDILNFPVDQINFIVAQFSAVLLSIFFRKYIHSKNVSISTRHWCNLAAGLCLGYFCFGYQIYHIFVQSMLSFIIMTSVTPKISHKLVMPFALLYMSLMHLQRQFYSYGSYTLDVTGPLMLLTQKVTSLAFDLHDGLTVPPEKLSEDQKMLVIRKLPSALEYFSYIFNFQTLMCGPLLNYAQYINFVNDSCPHVTAASSALKQNTSTDVNRPSPMYAVMKKLLAAVVFLSAIAFIQPLFPADRLTGDELNERSYWWIMAYIMVFTNFARFKYYSAWLLSDAVCNAGGIGFAGYDQNGRPLWNGVSNVDIYGFEFGTNMRAALSSWNISTQVWLKRYAYERMSRYRVIGTFLLSAIWHGFYPGYYLMFLSASVFTEAAKVVRRHIRPFFQHSKKFAQFYNVITMVTTRIVIAYISFSFVLLHLSPAIRIFTRLYFSIHIIAVLAYFIIPVVLPLKRKPVKEHAAANQNNNVEHQLNKNK